MGGTNTKTYVIHGHPFNIFDVGGQRNERRKWLSLFDRVNLLLFIAALNHYSSALFEDETKKAKRGWSAEEEALFVDGLSQFGRDWSAVAKHIGTGRKTPSIRSHAQVWFLKQLRDGHALPAKMLESGTASHSRERRSTNTRPWRR